MFPDDECALLVRLLEQEIQRDDVTPAQERIARSALVALDKNQEIRELTLQMWRAATGRLPNGKLPEGE